MGAYFMAHWIEWFFAACIALLTMGWRYILAKLRLEQEKNEAIAEGVRALLRECIVDKYDTCKEKGYCPIHVKRSLETVYVSYHKLGGNDVATALYEDVIKMPTEEVVKDE